MNRVRTKIVYAILSLTALLSGCRFWVSPAPDLDRVAWAEIVVIWDRASGTDAVTQTAWVCTNASAMADLRGRMHMASWQSLSIIARSHPTRVYIVTAQGARWEVHVTTDRDALKMFNLDDPGWSGWIADTRGFTDRLERIMSETSVEATDIHTDYSQRLRPAGPMTRITPPETLAQLRRFYVRL